MGLRATSCAVIGMALRFDIRSFPFIAAASLILAAVFGFVLGLIGGGVAVMPGVPVDDPVEVATDPVPSENRNRGTRGASEDRGSSITSRGPDSSREQPPVRNGGTPDTPRTGAVAPGEVRTLPEGRTDTLVQAANVEAATAQIQVTLTDARGNRMPMAAVALDIDAGPLGYQLMSTQPEYVKGERGVFLFSNLYPGDYRVRSTAANYAPVEQTVTISSGNITQQVTLALTMPDKCIVEFFPRFPDQAELQNVQIQTIQVASDGMERGRFGEHRTAGFESKRVVRPVAYWTQLGPGGSVRVDLVMGAPVDVTLSAFRDNANWSWSDRITPQGQTQRVDATLERMDESGQRNDGASGNRGDVTIALTVDGKADREFTNVTLRQQLDDFAYTTPTSSQGNRFTWTNLLLRNYYLVAEVRNVHARYVTQIEAGQGGEFRYDIKTGHLRVNAAREAGSPDPKTGKAQYRVRIKPQGHGTLETVFNGELTGKQSDYIDFYVPEGEYTVQVEAADTSSPLVAHPGSRTLTMPAGGDQSLDFTLRASCTLRFRCVTSTGVPVAGAEYLVTFNAAGSVPDSEKSNVRKGGADGQCEMQDAPYGPVYLMIWTTSADWNNPDRVFQLNLPAFEAKNLGDIVVAQ